MKSVGEIHIEQVGANDFRLTVIIEGQRFVCGSYLTRVAADRAGRLMIERREGEKRGRKKRVGKKR